MTSIEPAAPNQPVPLRSRQHVVTANPASTPIAAFRSENLEMAHLLAKSNMLGKDYNNNPGACLMLIDWAQRNDVALFEVPGSVAFRDGKATVGARMQRKLAARRGYLVKRVAGDEESCTVQVYGPDGNPVGDPVTYTMTLAKALGLTRNDLYQKDPAKMLFHRATTRALDYYGPSELAGVFAEEGPDELDPVDVVMNRAEAAGEDPVEAVRVALKEAEAVEVTADAPGKMVPPRTPISVPVETVGEETTAAKLARLGAEAGVKESTMLTQARRAGHTTLTTPAEIADNPAAAADVIQWLQEKIAAKADQ